MKTPHRIVLSLLIACAGTGARAVEAEQDSTWITPSSAARAEVVAELQRARSAGALLAGEAAQSVAAASSNGAAGRARIAAETREAVRLGLLPKHDSTRATTPDDEAKIRAAGLRALESATGYASR